MAVTARTATLPWDWYVSADILHREQELIFRGAWHYAGPADWVARPGDRFPCQAGAAPVVVARDGDGELRAYLNVCRHRGSVIVKERCTGKTLQCPYHAWTYGLDGSLRSAPRADREPSFEPGELGLRPVQVDSWGPFVFVNADLDAAPLAGCLGALPDLIDSSTLVFRERIDMELGANWKVAVENYLECYHCPVAHKASARSSTSTRTRTGSRSRAACWAIGERRGEGDGRPDCQFHLVWPALKVIVYPGATNLSLGPLWPVGPERSAGFLDYFFGPRSPTRPRAS